MEMIRSQARGWRQEVRSQAERRGARPARRLYPQGQARRAFAGQSSHPFESGRVGGRRGMERQPDRRGAGRQHRDDRANATATCRGRLRSRPDAQGQSQIGPSPDFRRRRGSQADRSGLRIGPGWPRQMDAASFGGESRRVADRRERQGQHDRADAQKNILQPHRKQQWVIAPEASAAFVANMEDVLEVYQRPHDPKRPLGSQAPPRMPR
jgi:hypothetical protein